MNSQVLLVVIIIGIALARFHQIEKHKHFPCPNCGNNFKVGKYKLLLAPHFFSYRYLQCPACKRRSFMRPEDD